jgi:hypothetical protein
MATVQRLEADVEGAAVERPASPRSELLAAVRYAGVVFLSVRVGVGLLALLGQAIIPSSGALANRFGEVPPAGWGRLLSAWERWDGQWYLRIIDAGYAPADDPPSAWFPVYPYLARLVRPVLGDSSIVAALVVSNLAFLAALVLFHRLTAAEYDEGRARRAVLYLAISPCALFFLAPYSESLFLLFALATFWAARRQRWALAGLAGALASGTRSVGFLLALPVAIEALRAARSRQGRARWSTLLRGAGGAALVPAGLVAYLAYWEVRRGDALFPLRVQRTSWGHEPWWPWRTLAEGVRQARFLGEYPNGHFQLDVLLVGFALGLAVWVLWRTPLSYSVWTVASMLVPLSTPIPNRVLLSDPRYFLVLFPLTWALVHLAERLRAHVAVVAVSSGLLTLLTVLHVTDHPVF